MLRRLSDLISGPHKPAAPGAWQDDLAPSPSTADLTDAQARRDSARQARAAADLAARNAQAELLRAEHPHPPVPDGAVWAQRPPAWHSAAPRPVLIGPANGTDITADLTLFHDCPRAEMILRQDLTPPDGRAPFALTLDTLRFEGSFLSLVITLPDDAAEALSARDVLQLDLWTEMSAPSRLYGRLNLQQGPNTAQMLSEFPTPDPARSSAAFDLAYGQLRDQPVDRAWVDLIVDHPAMTRLTFQDLILSRRPRAEL